MGIASYSFWILIHPLTNSLCWKVQKVVKVTKKELGFVDDNIIHALCKVYLFISVHRIVGWLVAEPVQTTHRVIPASSFGNKSTEIFTIDKKDRRDSKKSNEATFQFGDFRFRREPVKNSCPTTSNKLNKWDSGVIICEEKAVPAECGIMTIWVIPSRRRKKIATQLLDASRKSAQSLHLPQQGWHLLPVIQTADITCQSIGTKLD